jgi:Fic-DOC domain mobile mystery protein B
MMKFEMPFGATPLDLDEIEGLIPEHITTQSQLNEWESENILMAEQRTQRRLPKSNTLLSLPYLQSLHTWMFNKTWRWAGDLRRSNKNIGTDWISIAVETQQLMDDVAFQLENQAYSVDEIAARFHHRLVAIHLFSNGNGRHARLSTDILLRVNGQERFSWGRRNLSDSNDTRRVYIDALRLADKHDYSALIDFIRS